VVPLFWSVDGILEREYQNDSVYYVVQDVLHFQFVDEMMVGYVYRLVSYLCCARWPHPLI